MKRTFVICMTFFTLIILSLSCKKTEDFKFIDDIQEGISKAISAKKPIMLYFYGDNCSWCKKLEEETFTDQKVRNEFKKRFVSVKVYGDQHMDLLEKYMVRGYPTIVFIQDNGDEIDRISGFIDKISILNELERIFDRNMAFKDLKELNAKEFNLRIAREYMNALLQRGFNDEAIEVADSIIKNVPRDTESVVIKFELLFDRNRLIDDEIKKQFLDLSDTIENGIKKDFFFYHIPFYYRMALFNLDIVSNYKNALEYADKMLKSDLENLETSVIDSAYMVKYNVYKRTGNISEMRNIIDEIPSDNLEKNFVEWIRKVNKKEYLINLSEFEKRIAEFLNNLYMFSMTGQSISHDNPDLMENVPNDPITKKKMIFKVDQRLDSDMPDEIILETPNPEKYGMKRLYFSLKERNVVIEF